jgi:hypothetical protein
MRLRVTRKAQPIIYPYKTRITELATSSIEKDLGIWVADDLTWTKHVLERCAAKASKLLGFVRRSSTEITNTRTRRTLYLSVVHPVLGYTSQICSPQSIDLLKRTERSQRIQRRASKFILNLSYMCSESYRERLITTNAVIILAWVYGSRVLLQSYKWSDCHIWRCSPQTENSHESN